MKETQEKAERAAFEHTIFMALADIYTQLNPNEDIGEYLRVLRENKEAEKNRIINEAIRHA